MAKYPKKLVKFNIFNIRKLEFDATDIDISPIRQIDISISTITDIEINHIEIRSKNLDDYRYEIVSNRRDIDIYKDCVVNIDFNIDFNSIEEDNNSNYEIKLDNISINRSIRWPDNISINPIINNYKEASISINEIISIRMRAITNNGAYNYERGACITNNHICIDDISIISKSKKENDNVSVFIRV